MKVYVDSNVFVYSMFAYPAFGSACRIVTEDLENGTLEGVVSALVPVEVMSVAIRHDPSKAELAVTSVCSLPLKILEISRDILFQAPGIAVRYSLNGYDAVHIATALEAEARHVISNDDDLARIREITLVKSLDYERWKESW